MKLTIKKKNNNICIFNGNEMVEQYEYDKPINFIGLFNFLLKEEFKSEVTVEFTEFEKSEFDSELIDLIIEIINDYNNKEALLRETKTTAQ